MLGVGSHDTQARATYRDQKSLTAGGNDGGGGRAGSGSMTFSEASVVVDAADVLHTSFPDHLIPAGAEAVDA